MAAERTKHPRDSLTEAGRILIQPDGGIAAVEVDSDGGYAYWIEGLTSAEDQHWAVRRIGLDGGRVTTLAEIRPSRSPAWGGIAAVAGQVYVVTDYSLERPAASTLYRVEGGELKRVGESPRPGFAVGFTLIGDHAYWKTLSPQGSGELVRVTLGNGRVSVPKPCKYTDPHGCSEWFPGGVIFHRGRVELVTRSGRMKRIRSRKDEYPIAAFDGHIVFQSDDGEVAQSVASGRRRKIETGLPSDSARVSGRHLFYERPEGPRSKRGYPYAVIYHRGGIGAAERRLARVANCRECWNADGEHLVWKDPSGALRLLRVPSVS